MSIVVFFFFFNDTATTEIYTLSLHDALPILQALRVLAALTGVGLAAQLVHGDGEGLVRLLGDGAVRHGDRKSTRLNSSHANISYAVFCLKKKKKPTIALSCNNSHPLFYNLPV